MSTFVSLKEYLLIAQKLIAKLAPPTIKTKMLRDEDAISHVAHAIMMADWKWNPDYKSPSGRVKTKKSYRVARAIWAMSEYIEKYHNRKFTLSLSYDYGKSSSNKDVPLSGLLEDIKSSNPMDICEKKDEALSTSVLVSSLLASHHLTPRQSSYISEYFLKDKTLQEVGDIHGVTREAVRQGINKGLSKLQQNHREKMNNVNISR